MADFSRQANVTSLPIMGEMPEGQRGAASDKANVTSLPIMGEMPEGQRGAVPVQRGSCPYSFFKTASPDRYGILKEFAKENRNHQTDAEAFLWQQLKSGRHQTKFKRQHVIFDYIADFVCLEKKLVIEVDGGYHFTSDQMEWDAYRTEELEKMGFRVLRFTNEEVLMDINNVLDKIKLAIGLYE